MKIVDEKLLDEFGAPGPCEKCQGWRDRREPHHLFTRGMGGARRLDIRINLIALCTNCHTKVHAGKITLKEVLEIVAEREGVFASWITDEINRLRNCHANQIASRGDGPAGGESVDHPKDAGSEGAGDGLRDRALKSAPADRGAGDSLTERGWQRL